MSWQCENIQVYQNKLILDTSKKKKINKINFFSVDFYTVDNRINH